MHKLFQIDRFSLQLEAYENSEHSGKSYTTTLRIKNWQIQKKLREKLVEANIKWTIQ